MGKHINLLSHCTFCCNDYPKMVKFYEEVMGLEKLFTINFEQDIIDGYLEKGYPLEAKPGDEWISYMKIAPKEFIELFNVPYIGRNDTKNQEFHHVCLLVEDIFLSGWKNPLPSHLPRREPLASVIPTASMSRIRKEMKLR